MTTLPCPTSIPHTTLLGTVLSSHRTASGTIEYVRCSCGGFVVLSTPRGGARRQVSHAGR